VPRASPGPRPPRVVHETRSPLPGSSPRNPPARVVDRTARATVGRRPSRGCVCGAPTPVTSLPITQAAAAKRKPWRPGSVLPAPPFGGAPRLPRSSSPFPAKGPGERASETLVSGSTGGPASFEADQLLWGFIPHRDGSQVRASGGAWRTHPSSREALRVVHLGRDAPSPERLRPRFASSFDSPGRTCARLVPRDPSRFGDRTRNRSAR
jgi:hypothetical protein